MTKILLVRHGHVDGIAPERFRGRTELPLTPLGERQAAATAGRIAAGWSPGALYTSPMQRAVDTGAPIAAACGLRPQILPDLNDIDYGAWSWMTHDAARQADPAGFERWFAAPQLMRFPGGESLQDLAGRAADALRLVTQAHPEATVALVSHDSFNRALLMLLLDQPLSAYWKLAQSPCAISEMDFAGNGVRVLRVNDTTHLGHIR
jgi:probable phosphoglycerate mutase